MMVLSGSMEPAVKMGSVVVIKPQPEECKCTIKTLKSAKPFYSSFNFPIYSFNQSILSNSAVNNMPLFSFMMFPMKYFF